ncbi:MAG: hypothetical protein M1831_001404 [Alyxoria varia]|nr:MAG: hypothetical protein M1831_001404 [Alyxoria varia]
MTLFHVLSDKAAFPEPEKFDPTRWPVDVPSDGSGGEEETKNGAAGDCGGKKSGYKSANNDATGSVGDRKPLKIIPALEKITWYYMSLEGTGVEDVKAARDDCTVFARKGNRGLRVRDVDVFNY